MQQAKLVVLGYLAAGPLYGYEMEQKIEQGRARLWAKIGFSTIYKAMKDLARDGDVTAKTEEAERGLARRRYAITPQGRKTLAQEIAASLASTKPAYSDRMPGLVFAIERGNATAAKQIDAALTDIADRQKLLKAALKDAKGTPGAIALQYQADLLTAETKAIKAARAKLK